MLMLIGLLVGGVSSARAEQSRYTYQAAERYAPSMGVVVAPKDSDAKFVALPAGAGKFQWCTVDLKRAFSPGQYTIRFDLYSPGEDSPAVALYAADAKDRHQQLTEPCSVAPGIVGNVEARFFATAPFSSLVIKKMADGEKPSQAVGRIILTDMQQKDYPRLVAYTKLMRFPAPWGLASPVILQKLDTAQKAVAENFDVTLKKVADVEKWLDLRSEAADVFCRADSLLRVARRKRGRKRGQVPFSDRYSACDNIPQTRRNEKEISTKKKVPDPFFFFFCDAVRREEQALRNALALNHQADAGKALEQLKHSLDALEAKLKKNLGGSVLPETGTDIFTWLKAWELVGVEGGSEFSEPTPFQTGTMRLGDLMDLFSTWTTSTYRGPKITARYSVLTPLRTFDVKQQAPLHFDFPGAGYKTAADFDSTRAKGYIVLESSKGVLLFVFNRRPKDVQWRNDALTMVFPDGGAVGYVRLPVAILESQNKLAEAATFYQRLLLKQPAECVQIQNGNSIEQTFEYVERGCDWPVTPLTLAPVPPLAMLATKPSSHYQVKLSQSVVRAPDGWAYVNDTDTLRYKIPEIKRWNLYGVNLWNMHTREETYRQLREEGCRVVRLVCGASGDPWRDDRIDEMKAVLRKNLAWARQAGIRVGIDMHWEWMPDGRVKGQEEYSDPKKLAEVVRRWKLIIDWCQPFRDVVAWYDLLNEPDICYERESVKPYAAFMRKAVSELRPLAGDTPILVECVNGSNPVGLRFWEDLGDANVIAGYHDYWPPMFTHQNSPDRGDPAQPVVFYPSWMPMIEWRVPSWNNDNPEWYYWDRWKCDSISLPAFRWIITKGLRMDCGEYGVVGWAQPVPRGSATWLRHSMERFHRLGVSHEVWDYGVGGFTWNLPAAREEVLRFWRKRGQEKKGSGTNGTAVGSRLNFGSYIFARRHGAD
ncbi:MAG: cellulase family glycosylhydrolase, partial [Phycisphaerae bacterium]|nr:cellulase family glycosylhydrolase [Phycisphaerae bacterium]